MRTAPISTLAMLLAFCAGSGGMLHAVDIGEDAPALGSVTWVKGGAVAPAGKVTVVEFWATWCGPCKQSIPRLTKLQKKYGDRINIVGLSNEDKPTVTPFLAEMGDRMDYHVGICDDETAGSYMGERQSIPMAFLIDAKGKVAWAGHPLLMSLILAQLVDGTFDAVKQAKITALEAQAHKLLNGKKKQIDKALAVLDQALTLDPVDIQALQLRLAIADFIKKPELVRETLSSIPIDKLDAETANGLVEERLAEDTLAQRHLDLALAFSDRALQAEPADAEVFTMRARLFATFGLLDEARALAEKAVSLAPGDPALAANVAYYRDLQALHQSAAPSAFTPAPAPPKQVPAAAAVP